MPVQDSDLAVTYSLIHSFLTGRSHFKAAEAVKKAAKDIIVIKSVGQEGPALPVIVKQWKKFTASQGKKAAAPSESTGSERSSSDSASDSSESSDSSSEESSPESDARSDIEPRRPKSDKRSGAKITLFPVKASIPPRPNANAKSKVKPPASKPSSESEGESSSSSDPESSDSDDGGAKKSALGSTPKGVKAEKATPVVLPESESGDSSSSDSDSESEEGGPTPKVITMKVGGTATLPVHELHSPAGSSQTLPSVKSSDDSGSGSESSDNLTSVEDSNTTSDSDDTSNTGKKLIQTKDKPQGTKVANATSAPVTASSQKSNGSTAVTKRRRTDEAGSSIATSIIQQPKPSNPYQNKNGKGQSRKTNTPFSRIKVDEIKFADERLRDNTFGSRKAATNDYGSKANADLVVTRGVGFRKEKNKKKRGSYRGGDITMESHSIKFAD